MFIINFINYNIQRSFDKLIIIILFYYIDIYIFLFFRNFIIGGFIVDESKLFGTAYNVDNEIPSIKQNDYDTCMKYSDVEL